MRPVRQKMSRKRVLFICTHNSARSQMAEGLVNEFFTANYIAFSAGTKPTKVSKYAIQVLREVGVDISSHKSKSVNDFVGEKFDYVVTVCAGAKETCPFFPGAKKYIHIGFPDPSEFRGTDKEKKDFYREIRDQIMGWLQETFS